MAKWPKSFKDAYCERYHCAPEDYEESLFRRAVFRHALPLALWIKSRDPEFFREDLDMIHEVGRLKSQDLFRQEINYFFGRNLRNRSRFRTLFRVRVSGKRLMRISRKLFPRVG